MLRSLTVVALLASTAAAYPLTLPHLDDAARAKQATTFRQRNAGTWTVDVDVRGFVKRVVTTDPAFVPAGAWTDASVAKVRELIKKNADLMGIDPAEADRLTVGNLLVVNILRGALLSEINVRIEQGTGARRVVIDTMFEVKATPTVDEKALAARVIGQSYADTIGYAEPPMRDCAMSPGGTANCVNRVTHTRQRDVTLTAHDVRTATWIHDDGKVVRVIVCADASLLGAPAADPSWGHIVASRHTFVPKGSGPKLPLVVDAVTGAELAVPGNEGCFLPGLANVR